MYECTICLSLNHAARLHCQNCGTIPAMYSLINKPCVVHLEETAAFFIPVFASPGAQAKHRAARCNLKTVPLDYYAE